MPEPEHKKSMYPYVEPTVQTADEIDKTQQLMTTISLTYKLNLAKLTTSQQNKRNKRKQKTLLNLLLMKITPLITLTISGGKMTSLTIETLKKLQKHLKIQDISDNMQNILRNILPVDNQTVEELIDDDVILIDDRTQ